MTRNRCARHTRTIVLSFNAQSCEMNAHARRRMPPTFVMRMETSIVLEEMRGFDSRSLRRVGVAANGA
jgi:hypothetical protein